MVQFSPYIIASNFEQVANLLWSRVNSASYSQRYKKWVVAFELWTKV